MKKQNNVVSREKQTKKNQERKIQKKNPEQGCNWGWIDKQNRKAELYIHHYVRVINAAVSQCEVEKFKAGDYKGREWDCTQHLNTLVR